MQITGTGLMVLFASAPARYVPALERHEESRRLLDLRCKHLASAFPWRYWRSDDWRIAVISKDCCCCQGARYRNTRVYALLLSKKYDGELLLASSQSAKACNAMSLSKCTVLLTTKAVSIEIRYISGSPWFHSWLREHCAFL